MKVLIGILIALLVAWGAYKIYDHWNTVKEQNVLEEKAASGADIDPNTLPGIPYQLEQKYRDAQQAGPVGLKRFIDYCKQYPDVKDPRFAWIQLDYAVLISGTDPVEAKKIFLEVKKRTPPDSPIMPRIRQLSKTYE